MEQEYTINELIKLVKSIDGSDMFVKLLERIVNQVADTRIKLMETENDTLELRQEIVKVINEMIINPLTMSKKIKEKTNLNDYN